MNCACEDGIPGSAFKVEIGLAWFNIIFRAIASIPLSETPITAHNVPGSCLQMRVIKSTATSHLLCINGNRSVKILTKTNYLKIFIPVAVKELFDLII